MDPQERSNDSLVQSEIGNTYTDVEDKKRTLSERDYDEPHQELSDIQGVSTRPCKKSKGLSGYLVAMKNPFNFSVDDSKSAQVPVRNFDSSPHIEHIQGVPGLYLIREWFSKDQERNLLDFVDGSEWLDDLSQRRVQHQGFKYDYKARRIDMSQYLGPLPDWSLDVAQRLQKALGSQTDIASLLTRGGDSSESSDTYEYFNSCIINEYVPPIGIGRHVDCVPCFGSIIVSISLGSSTIMTFSPVTRDASSGDYASESVNVVLPRRSVVILTGESRYKWTHEITRRKFDMIDGKKITRGRRVSLTYRRAIVDGSINT